MVNRKVNYERILTFLQRMKLLNNWLTPISTPTGALTLPALCISESRIKMKINFKSLKAFNKTLWGTTKNCENKH